MLAFIWKLIRNPKGGTDMFSALRAFGETRTEKGVLNSVIHEETLPYSITHIYPDHNSLRINFPQDSFKDICPSDFNEKYLGCNCYIAFDEKGKIKYISLNSDVNSESPDWAQTGVSTKEKISPEIVNLFNELAGGTKLHFNDYYGILIMDSDFPVEKISHIVTILFQYFQGDNAAKKKASNIIGGMANRLLHLKRNNQIGFAYNRVPAVTHEVISTIYKHRDSLLRKLRAQHPVNSNHSTHPSQLVEVSFNEIDI